MRRKQQESAVAWENLISKLLMQYLNKVFNTWRQAGIANIVAHRAFPQAVGMRLFWLVVKQFGRVRERNKPWPQGQGRFQTTCISRCSYNIKAIFLLLLWNHYWWLLATSWAPSCSQRGGWEITSDPKVGDEFNIKAKAPGWLHRGVFTLVGDCSVGIELLPLTDEFTMLQLLARAEQLCF